jgi:hypothetical protein
MLPVGCLDTTATEADMRTFSAIALAASLYAVPAMSQVIFQVPDSDAARHEQRAQRDRADARAEHREAQMDAAMGNYGAAAQDQREARRDWHDAQRQDDRARGDSTTVILGR